MEDEIGIFDPDGINGYAAYFRDALVDGVSVESNAEDISNGASLPVSLQYKIGNMRLEGKLMVIHTY